MDINECKKNALDRINKDIDKLSKQANYIKNFNLNNDITFEDWKTIRETPLRYDKNFLINVAESLVPEGEQFQYDPNGISFRLNGIKVILPLCSSEYIEVHLNHLYVSKPCMSRKFERMRNYFELIDKGGYSWYDLAQCRYSYHTDSKIRLFIWWFLKAKWRKVDRDRWEKEFEKIDRANEERLKKYNEEIQNNRKVIPKIKSTLDYLTKITDVRIYHSGCYCSIDELDDLIRNLESIN